MNDVIARFHAAAEYFILVLCIIIISILIIGFICWLVDWLEER